MAPSSAPGERCSLEITPPPVAIAERVAENGEAVARAESDGLERDAFFTRHARELEAMISAS